MLSCHDAVIAMQWLAATLNNNEFSRFLSNPNPVKLVIIEFSMLGHMSFIFCTAL